MLTKKIDYALALMFIGGSLVLFASMVSGKELSVALYRQLAPLGAVFAVLGLYAAVRFGDKGAAASVGRAYRGLTIGVVGTAVLGPWGLLLFFFGAGPNDPPSTWILMDTVLVVTATCSALGAFLCGYAIARPPLASKPGG